MSLASTVLAGMLLITPATYLPVEGSDRMRTYENIALDIAEAVENPLGELPFAGPAAQQATADALTAIAANESSYDQRVRDCRIKGDKGRSISIFQLNRGTPRGGYSEKSICSDPVLAARLAVNVLGWYQRASATSFLFNGYATGWAEKTNYAASRQNRIFLKLIGSNRIRISKKKGEPRLYAEFDSVSDVSLRDEFRHGADPFPSGSTRLSD